MSILLEATLKYINYYQWERKLLKGVIDQL